MTFIFCTIFFIEQVKLHIEEVRKLIPLTKRSGLSKSNHLVKYFGVAYDDFRKEVWVSRLKAIKLTISQVTNYILNIHYF